MRAYLLPIVLLLGLTASPANGQQQFPYKALITADDVYVRSGPGTSYYPTAKMKSGDQIEVYRHDPGGWYAIKPPSDSYTWVSGRYIRPVGDGLAEVTGDRVAARVGSRFSDIRDVIQIRLHRGEVVELQGKKAGENGPDGQTWHKIAPPSGEFRWVSGKYVDREYARDGVRKAPGGNSPIVQHTATTPNTQPDASLSDQPGVAASDSPHAHEAEPEQYVPRELTPEQFKLELTDTELALSIMVAEEATVWNFDRLTLKADDLLVQAETAVERGRARLLVNKIARFEDIKQRHHAVNSMRDDVEQRNTQLADLSRVRGTVDERPDDDKYDGRGRLTRVVAPKLGAPRYAIVDEESGDVRCYVTPAPGMNLGHYLGRTVGINGVRGYMPEQKAQHVMAKHITSLEARKLR